MKLTEQQLLRIFPNARLVAGVFVVALQRAMDEREIDTPARRAAFLAQVGHESSQLTRLVENLNYSAQGLAATWPSRYLGPDGQPNALALRLARNPQAIADNTYATRNGNGDEASGDGWRFRGRGLLQITGRANYRLVGEALGEPLEAEPWRLEQPVPAARSAAWWWAGHGLNELADRGEFAAITHRINGGLNGQAGAWRCGSGPGRCCHEPARSAPAGCVAGPAGRRLARRRPGCPPLSSATGGGPGPTHCQPRRQRPARALLDEQQRALAAVRASAERRAKDVEQALGEARAQAAEQYAAAVRLLQEPDIGVDCQAAGAAIDRELGL